MKNKVLACLVVLTMAGAVGIVGAGVAFSAEKVEKCKPCKGKGDIVQKNVKCSSCDKGKITCSACNGKKLVRKNEGTFQADLFLTKCTSCKGSGTQKCGACNGKGKYDITEKCRFCRGTGKLEW